MKITKENLKQIIKEEIEAVLKEKKTEDKYVFDADALERWPDTADRKEMCNNKSNRGEKVQWVIRNGKGRCEKAS